MKRLLALIVFLSGCSGGDFTSGLFDGVDAPDAGEAHTDSAPFLAGGAPGKGGAPGAGGVGGAPELDAGQGSGGSSRGAGGSSHGTGGSSFQETGGSFQMGGAPGTGGVVSVDGGASGGSLSTGGSLGGCSAKEKMCDGSCVSFAPDNGCGALDCSPCAVAAPVGGVQACNVQGACDFVCTAGYFKSAGTCVKL